MGFKDYCIYTIQQSGARLTNARIAVISCIESAHRSLTAREIFEKTKKYKDGRHLDQATVYRILELLQSLKLVHRIAPDGQYRPCTHHGCGNELHLLISCNSCGSTEEEHVPKSALDSLQSIIKNKLKFTPTDHCIQISGMCSACSAR